jgi:ribosomal protein S18 acetylase RimI-like enzyme
MPSRITPEIRRLSEYSFTEALQIWNEGFKGYFADMTMTMDAYLSRLHWLFLSPELSLVAFHEGKPVGCLLNGVREHQGRKIAWNGGTGVSPEFRGAGIGKALVKAALELYREQEVNVAMLEAIRENERAIKLYQSFGYETVDRLIFYKHDGAVGFPKVAEEYSVRTATPLEVGQLDFYQDLTPWQTQWQTLTRNRGEALIVVDRNGAAAGYALYRRQFDQQGILTGIAIHQCVVQSGRADAEAIGISALRSVYAPLDEASHRTTNNFSAASVVICRLLEDAGFTIFAEQVHMIKRLS